MNKEKMKEKYQKWINQGLFAESDYFGDDRNGSMGQKGEKFYKAFHEAAKLIKENIGVI